MEELFTLLSERYEKKRVLLTSNLIFSQWDQIFKDLMMTMAAVDRLVHHAVILEFNGRSYRAAEVDAAKTKPMGRPAQCRLRTPPVRLCMSTR
jgi:DNA replication protein DnaC